MASQSTPGDIRWLSTAEAAARLGITPRTLYRFIDEGQVPGYRFGRVIRLKADEVDQFIESCRIEPGTLDHLYPDPSEPLGHAAHPRLGRRPSDGPVGEPSPR